MAISGSLEDVSVADVMQFIHLGRRTGTLVLRCDGEQALIGFHSGKLVSAKSPETPKLGDLLVREELVDQATVDQAVAVQAAESDDERRTLGRILLAMEAVTTDHLKRVISGQIEQSISDLVLWDRGTFEFVTDDLRPVDDIALYPGDLVPDADINTQMVLLEAARIFDEKNRGGDRDGVGEETHPTVVLPPRGSADSAGGAAVATAPPPRPAVRAETESADAVPEPADEDEIGAHRLQILSSDDTLAERLSRALPPGFAPVERVALQRAGKALAGHEAPIVLVDLREEGIDVDELARLRRTRLGAPVIALVTPDMPSGKVYEAGALAALPPEVDPIVACVANVARNRRRSAPKGALPEMPEGEGAGVARLRRVFGDLRSGLISATVALNLMHIISESVERAVLFLVKKDRLSALGAFGAGADGRPLAEVTRGLTVELEGDHALAESLEQAEVQTVRFEEANLPAHFADIVGPPANEQIVVFPVLGAQRVIAVIYTDNGENESPIEDIDILELAAAQVGMAFENELLRRQIQSAD